MIRYLILDASSDPRRVAAARAAGARVESLFRRARPELEAASPFLVEVATSPVLSALVLSRRGPTHAGIILDTPAHFDALRGHLRRYLRVERERGGRIVFLRFYDPRVLCALLPAFRPDEAVRFSGPIVAWHAEDGEGGVITFRVSSRGIRASRSVIGDFRRVERERAA